MHNTPFWLYALVCGGVTYLIRMLPLVLMKKKPKSRFVLSFLYYIPYAVLSVMTIPAILYATGSLVSGIVGLVCAVVLAYYEKGLSVVAGCSCTAVFLTEMLLKFL